MFSIVIFSETTKTCNLIYKYELILIESENKAMVIFALHRHHQSYQFADTLCNQFESPLTFVRYFQRYR